MIRSTENSLTFGDIQQPRQHEFPSNGVLKGHNGQHYRWFEEESVEVADEFYCVARLGTDGMVIPGSRLSSDFTSPSAVCIACDELRKQYPDAAVFGSLIVDRLATLS